MADGEEAAIENVNSEGNEEEVDLARCASEFAQYCQVDVRKEVKSPFLVHRWKYFENLETK